MDGKYKDNQDDEFEEDVYISDYFDDYCDECRSYGDDYRVDEDGDLICMCDNCVHDSNNWDDGYWIGDD